MDNHLITVEEFQKLARPVSIHIDTDEVATYIHEAEDAYIIPALGYKTCKNLIEMNNAEGKYINVTQDVIYLTEVNQYTSLVNIESNTDWNIVIGDDIPTTPEEDDKEKRKQYARLILIGGEWTDKCKNLHYCNGLKKAIAYFVYARMVRADGTILTRTGFMQHGSNYSTHLEEANRRGRYNDTMDMAEKYLAEVLAVVDSIRQCKCGNNYRYRGSRARIHAIGD